LSIDLDEFEQIPPEACFATVISKKLQLTGKVLNIHRHLQSLGDHVQLNDLLSQQVRP
jgi:hypothetical protein